MARYAILNASGDVINVIQWDGESKWEAPAGCRAILDDDVHGIAEIGGKHDGASFVARVKPDAVEKPLRRLTARKAPS